MQLCCYDDDVDGKVQFVQNVFAFVSPAPNFHRVSGSETRNCINYTMDLYEFQVRLASSATYSWRGPLKTATAGGERRRTRVEVSARDDFGFTALHYAAQSGLAKCIEYLLAHGANAFAETREGLPPA